MKKIKSLGIGLILLSLTLLSSCALFREPAPQIVYVERTVVLPEWLKWLPEPPMKPEKPRTNGQMLYYLEQLESYNKFVVMRNGNIIEECEAKADEQ